MWVSSNRGATRRILVALSLAALAAGCADSGQIPPRTVVTRPLSPLGPYPNLSTVPPRPPPPTSGVARADETVVLGQDRSQAQEADRTVRETGPVPPPAASSATPNFALLGGVDSPMSRRAANRPRREQASPDTDDPAPVAATPPADPTGPIVDPLAEPPPAMGETAQTRLAIRPPPGTVETAPAPPSTTASAPAVTPPGAPAPALTVRFRLNSVELPAAGLAQLDGFAQRWASSGRGLIALAVRRTDDLGAAREKAVMEGLEKAGVPAGAIMTGRITLRNDVVEVWRE